MEQSEHLFDALPYLSSISKEVIDEINSYRYKSNIDDIELGEVKVILTDPSVLKYWGEEIEDVECEIIEPKLLTNG